MLTRSARAALGTLVLAGGLAGIPRADAVASAAALPTHVNGCWSTDKVPPVIDSLVATPSTVDADSGPVEVPLTVAAHDVGGPGPATGIGRVAVRLEPGSAATGATFGTELRAVLHHGSDGLWHGAVTVPAGTNATYTALVSARDRSADGTMSTQSPPRDASREFPAFEATSTIRLPSRR